MSVTDDAPEDTFPWHRDPRVTLKADIHVRRLGNRKTEVILHDVSNAGCRVELNELVEPGELLWVTLPGLQPIEARAAWVDKWIVGLKFVNPLHPAVFDALLPRIKK